MARRARRSPPPTPNLRHLPTITEAELETCAPGLYVIVDRRGRRQTKVEARLYDVENDEFLIDRRVTRLARVRPDDGLSISGVEQLRPRADGKQLVIAWVVG